MTAVGIDGCRGGWVAVALGDGTVPQLRFATTIRELAAAFPDARGIGIDIPIGLADAGPRAADLEARARLGPRRSSVFLTPIRPALEAPSYAAANEVSRRVTGQGISRQAYALRARILEVEGWTAQAPCPVWEVHPELSFAALLGRPARASKKTWHGIAERRRALHDAGVDLDRLTGDAGRRAAVDDVVDAAVVAWSACRLVAGRGRPLPDPPEADVHGTPMAIWT